MSNPNSTRKHKFASGPMISTMAPSPLNWDAIVEIGPPAVGGGYRAQRLVNHANRGNARNA
jgi:hypothetical protein